jgi:transposase
MRRDGKSYNQIKKLTGLERSTIQRIVNAPASKRARKGKATKSKLITSTELKRVIKFLSASWPNQTMLYSCLHAACKIKASTDTLRRALKATGYWRCVACRRPFINKKQAAKRVAFCEKYRWWSLEQ